MFNWYSFWGHFQAKALAEKNMRDLFAQKEQAERNVMIYSINNAVQLWQDVDVFYSHGLNFNGRD